MCIDEMKKLVEWNTVAAVFWRIEITEEKRHVFIIDIMGEALEEISMVILFYSN